MPDDLATSAKRSARHRKWLLLALVPIIAGTLWLASWPPKIHRAYLACGGRYVCTATQLEFDPGRWEVRRLDLQTGRTVRLSRLVESTTHGHLHDDWWAAGTGNEHGLTSLSFIRLADFSEEQVADPDRWKLAPQRFDGERLIGVDRDGHLLIVHRSTGIEQHFPFPAANTNRSMIRVTRADRAVIWERPVGGGLDKHRLISFRRSIPLRDIFFITAAVSVLLAVVRFVSPHAFAAREAAELALIAITVSLIVVAATWAGLSRQPWAVRLVLLSLVVLTAEGVLPAVYPEHRAWYHGQFVAKSQAFIALFSLGTTLIFRSYGWRLCRTMRACADMEETIDDRP